MSEEDAGLSFDALLEQAAQAQSWFDKWLGKHNDDEWSLTRLNDAQKESVLWIAVSLIFAACLWKGFPRDYREEPRIKTDEFGEFIVEKDQHGKDLKTARGIPQYAIEFQWTYQWFSRIGVLQPIKYLTVLYHEMCHAIVGTLTGGKVLAIMVDWNEGGATFFDPKHKRPYAEATFPAGYIGSCTIGCVFVFCGFDIVASRYAAVAYGAMALISLLICMKVLTKSHLYHHRFDLQIWFARMTGNEEKRGKYEDIRKRKKKEDLSQSKLDAKVGSDMSDKDKMASMELILGTTAFIGAIIAVSWFLWDSMYLRFVILFLGVINALYAIWDVWLDGVKYGQKVSSDCTQMAKIFNRPRSSDKKVSVKNYAYRWLAVEVALLVSVIFAGLYTFREYTLADQALRARNSLWPTSNHYTPANILQTARDQAAEVWRANTG